MTQGEGEFNQRVDDTLLAVEEAIEDSGVDIDCDNQGGRLSLRCADGSSLIFSRQAALGQLWLAARDRGYHFAWEEGGWRCVRSGRSLAEIFAELSAEQAGVAIQLAGPSA